MDERPAGEGPDAQDADLFGDAADIIPCAHCGEELHVDAQQCPHCRAWLVERDRPAGERWRNPWMRALTVATIVLLILALVWWSW